MFPSFRQFDLPTEEYADCLPDGELLAVPLVVEEKNNDASGPGGPVPSPSLDFNDNEDIPTELSDSSETHDECNPIDLFLYIIYRKLFYNKIMYCSLLQDVKANKKSSLIVTLSLSLSTV